MRSKLLSVEESSDAPVFPIYMRYKKSNKDLIVMFIGLREGIIMYDSVNTDRVGILETGFYPFNETEYWEKFTGVLELKIRNGQ